MVQNCAHHSPTALRIPRIGRTNGMPITVGGAVHTGFARARAHSKAQLRKWGKEGGRPVSLDRKALDRLQALLSRGKSQAECAAMFGVSVRTIGRLVARIKASDNHFQPA